LSGKVEYHLLALVTGTSNSYTNVNAALDHAATGNGFVHVSFCYLVTRNNKDRTEHCASWSPI